jgi:hypothetical protein
VQKAILARGLGGFGCFIARFARNPGRRRPELHDSWEIKIPTLSQNGDKGEAPSSSEILALSLLGLGRSADAHALGVEDESLRFGFCALRLDLFTIPEKADAGGVADPDYQLVRGVE